jgi:hypothetical protein
LIATNNLSDMLQLERYLVDYVYRLTT